MKRSEFPFDCKIAKLKPLYQKGSKTDPQNYRPVSFLPLVSKVIQKVIHNQTEIFLSKDKILYKYQSGFRKSFSTNSCLTLLKMYDTIKLVDEISLNFLELFITGKYDKTSLKNRGHHVIF